MRPESSDYFVVAALIVKDELDKSLRGDLARIRQEAGRPTGSLLHFRKMGHATKVKVSREIGASPNVAAVTSVIMCKRHLINDAGKEPFISAAGDRAEPLRR